MNTCKNYFGFAAAAGLASAVCLFAEPATVIETHSPAGYSGSAAGIVAVPDGSAGGDERGPRVIVRDRNFDGGGGSGPAFVALPQSGNKITFVQLADAQHGPQREVTWLGVGAEEAAEVLTAQLGLDPGVGLEVTFVASNSPAAKAGLEKNDVLVELAGQELVHPAQLRKLVQVRKENDEVKIEFYRAGKKQSAKVTLGKTLDWFGQLDGERGGQNELAPLPSLPRLQGQIQDLQRELVTRWKSADVQNEIRRSIDTARRSYEDAMRQMTNANLEPLRKALENLRRTKIQMDGNTAITLRSSGKSAKSIVKTDESGTIVIVCNPKPYLTAHDQDGKLLFDGEIDTPEQRTKVPADLWQQVEPLLNKLNSGFPEKMKSSPLAPKGSVQLEDDAPEPDL